MHAVASTDKSSVKVKAYRSNHIPYKSLDVIIINDLISLNHFSLTTTASIEMIEMQTLFTIAGMSHQHLNPSAKRTWKLWFDKPLEVVIGLAWSH